MGIMGLKWLIYQTHLLPGDPFYLTIFKLNFLEVNSDKLGMKLLIFLLFLSLALFASEEEESEALKAMRLSCVKQKIGLGCFNYANMLVRIDKSDTAEKFYELGCKLEHQPSCSKDKWDIPDRK